MKERLLHKRPGSAEAPRQPVRNPVVLIIFNRPDLTERIIAEIARARPSRLLVIADGPRPDHAEDAEKCAAARAVMDRVDWPCEVRTNYAPVNLGCRDRVVTGLTWAFEQVAQAMILEDDCLPSPGFFRFCDELLDRYRDDPRLMHICGNSLQWFADRPIEETEVGPKHEQLSYFFSFFNLCGGGWASWRSAWRHYDRELALWPTLAGTSWLVDMVGDPRAARHWRKVFEKAYASRGDIDDWDYLWTFTCWSQGGLAIVPNSTLVSNIGFRSDATHMKSANDRRASLPLVEMYFPLRHPPRVARDLEIDRFIVKQIIARRWTHT